MGSAKAGSWARRARAARARSASEPGSGGAEVCGECLMEGGWREVAVELGLGNGFQDLDGLLVGHCWFPWGGGSGVGNGPRLASRQRASSFCLSSGVARWWNIRKLFVP